jgi:hypothetical protein
MIIPKAFTVGPKRYDVIQVRALDRPPAHGRIDIIDNTIKLAVQSIYEQRYSVKQRRESFWHEALHACLHDMGKPLSKHDEDFIDALAKRITQICCTAEV